MIFVQVYIYMLYGAGILVFVSFYLFVQLSGAQMFIFFLHIGKNINTDTYRRRARERETQTDRYKETQTHRHTKT